MKKRLSLLLSLVLFCGNALPALAEQSETTELLSTTSTRSENEATAGSEVEETSATEATEATEAIAAGGFDMTQVMEKANTLGAYFGYQNIAGQNYLGFQIQPELQIGKLGFGLDVPIQFNLSTWKFRTDQYTDGVGLLRMIRYLSWGFKKQDPFYIKVGDLSGSFLGYGMLINNYSNSISIDKRKIGIDLDYCYKDFLGIEILYSDVNIKSLNLLGIRPYIKPFGFTHIPIIRTFDVGVQFVTDRDNTGSILSTDAGSNHNTFIGSGGMNGYALDMGMTLLNLPGIRLTAFASGAMLQKNTSSTFGAAVQDSLLSSTYPSEFKAVANSYDNGYGISAGLDLKFKFLGMIRMDVRAERLWYTKNYVPHFFDITYEMNKDARIMTLVGAEKQQGVYGDLGLIVLDKIKVSGGLLMPDDISAANPALLKLTLDASKLTKSILLEGHYIKGGLTQFEDAITLDERSLLYVRAAYKIAKLFYVGMDYNWTWAADVNGKFLPSHSFQPYVGFKFDLDFLNKM